jgi:hypothetical protein
VYLKPLAPYTSGYFFNEDCLYYANEPDHASDIRIDYWELPAYVIDTYHKWVTWGTQREVRLSKICELPHVDHIICETFPPIIGNLYKYISTYKQIIRDHNKTFGLMLHGDDSWGLDGKDLESDRWAAIQYFQPTIIARFPINRLFPTDLYYNKD